MAETNGRRNPHRDERRVFLGMPGYGNLTDDAARGFWSATRLPRDRVVYCSRRGSLLAANFNALWVDALNHVHRRGRLDYFAMQHADVGPQDWWLDTLIDELEAHDLDVLGVPVPIKDRHGVTSLALDRPDGDTWRPLCRPTMTEVHRLPPTFTSEDVGHPLLLNTGLWVCRFDLSWVKKVHFTINDRIVYDAPADRYAVQVEPEDWYFSRLLHELGLKVGCTRKVALNHRGEVDFPNTHPWGEPFDSAYLDSSVVPDDLPGFRYPYDVPGWLRPDEGRTLARLAKGKRVLEIGSYCGASTVCLAQTADHVHAVDPHDGRATPVPQDTLAKMRANLERYGVADKVSVHVGTLDTFVPWQPFDLIFVDGAHDAESVAYDVRAARDMLAPGGLLAFHDYDSNEPAVTAAVDDLILRGAAPVSLSVSLAVVRPPALHPLALEV